MITALIIFIITYIIIGLRQIPRVHIDRPAGALVGAVLMIAFGVLTLDQAFAAIDMHTLLLLLGMMIITVYLKAAGFFELMADKILSLSKTPLQLLIFVAVSSGLLSALFVNDTICLLYTPIILEVTIQLGVNPMPYLIALPTSSNIGSVMTDDRQSPEHAHRHLLEDTVSFFLRRTLSGDDPGPYRDYYGDPVCISR
jgi:Na+/H+ antiporter NhaD/arsenite permease-like protein